MGTRRRVDLAVPAHAPIAEYTPALLKLCGQEGTDDTFPPAWSLALPGARPFAPEASLTSSGVVDGAVLYLRDSAAGEYDAPVVTDLEEVIADVSESGVPWDARHRAGSALVLGLLSLICGLVAMTVVANPDPAAGLAAIVCGGGAVLLAWQAARRRWAVLLGPRLALALSAAPLFAIAADALLVDRDGMEAALAAASAGALIGALAARLALPHVTTLLGVWLSALALPVTVSLYALHATLVESVAVVAVVAFAVLGVAPTVSGHLAAMAVPSTPGTADNSGDVPWLVGRGKRVLIAINALCSAVLAVCSAVLGLTGDGFAVGLSACLGLALLLLYSGGLRLLAAVLPPITAGVVALGAALIHAPALSGLPLMIGPAVLAGLGAVAAGAGLARSVRPGPEAGEEAAWRGQLAWVLVLLSLLLAVGVFGVYPALMHYGESL